MNRVSRLTTALNQRGPSLFWRSVLASTALVACAWGALLFIIVLGVGSDDSELDPGGRRAAVLAIVRHLADEPTRLQAVLSAFDLQQRHHDLLEEGDIGRLNMVVRDGTRLVFASPGQTTGIEPNRSDRIERVLFDGHDWQQLCARDGTVSVCLVSRLYGLDQILSASFSRALLLPPLLLLPLTLPAFALAVWWTLRPVRRLSQLLLTQPRKEGVCMLARDVPIELRTFFKGVQDWRAEMLAARRRERAFVGNAAHELRTPLTAIQVNAEALLRQEIPEKERLHLQGLLSGSQRMTRVVEQLLSLLRNESGRAGASGEALNMRTLLQERLAEVSLLADQRGISLTLDAPNEATIQGDREQLESVIDNLVSNAIKYGPCGSEVNVVLRQEADRLHLEVRDEGPGIADENKQACFERFRRFDDSGQPGAGLGLSIVKAAVEAHGGHVWLEDQPKGSGLRAHVVLPVGPLGGAGAG